MLLGRGPGLWFLRAGGDAAGLSPAPVVPPAAPSTEATGVSPLLASYPLRRRNLTMPAPTLSNGRPT